MTYIRLAVWILTVISPLRAEENYQRYDMERKREEITVEGTVRYRTEKVGGSDLYTLAPEAGLEYGFAHHHSVSVKLPYTLSLYEHPEARNKTFYAIGDIHLSYEYMKQMGHVNLFFNPAVTMPLTTTDEYKMREGVLSTEAGRYTTGFAFSVTGARDPVVWTVGMQYGVGLPKEERFYTAWQPGNIQISGGISHLFNERFGSSVSIYQQINLPEISGGVFDREGRGISASTLAKMEALILFEKDYIKLGAEAYLHPLSQPVAFSFTYG
ncbi:MAG: hypothetical protein LBL45_04380, partial [Treponema sp.]|nr:hypothetical protein [Treponema sp.]